MAEELDDDLNAFFNDVQEVASAVTDKEEKLEKPPPAKKQKKEAAPLRPRGVVVASASNKTVKSIETPIDREQPASLPPPPPRPAPTVSTTVLPAPQIKGTCSNEPWPDKDFRLFAGNLDPATNDDQLFQHFAKYASLNQVRVIRDNKGNSKGYGFVSFSNALECAKALREQDQTWLGSRPIRVKRYHGTDQDVKSIKKKHNKRGARKL